MEQSFILIPPAPRLLMEKLTNAGFQAYVVGGCVRDSLLGLQPHDWDICTDATPAQMKLTLYEYPIVETGLKHGTLTVMVEKQAYEITTFRTEGAYTDHRHPDFVSFVGTLQEDLQRRDFTINAMAAGLDGKIIDLFGGREDLQSRLIRCVGNADDRFQEDALRILRAMRFASRYDCDIECDTKLAMRQWKNLLSFVSAERISKELSGILVDNCQEVLRWFPDVLSVWIPEIMPCVNFEQHNPYHDKDVWLHTVAAVAASPKDLIVRLALLYHDLGKPQCFSLVDGIGHFYGHPAVSADIAEKSLTALRFDRQTIHDVTQLVAAHDRVLAPRKPVLRRCLNQMGETQLRRLLEVKEADQTAQTKGEDRLHKTELLQLMDELLKAQARQEDCFTLKNLAVNGNDLIAIGYQPGKMIGLCLNNLLNAVMDGKLKNDRETLIQTAKEFLRCY